MKPGSRFALEFPVSFLPRAERGETLPPHEAVSTNLSLTGISLEFIGKICPVRIGDSARLVISLGELLRVGESPELPVIRQVEMVARVAWVTGSRCGFQIQEMPDASRSFYENLLSGYQTLFEFSPAFPVKLPAAA